MGRLLRLRDQRAQELAAIETTIALLNGAAVATKRGRAGSVLDEALALDAARVGKRKRQKPSAAARKQNKDDIRARRTRSFTFLSKFDREKPTRVPNAKGIAPLLLHGYLKKKGDGYVRTAREFSVEKH
jgi:hypothetical protein